MFKDLNNLIDSEDNNKSSLVKILKKIAKTITVYDQMKVINEIKEELVYTDGPLKETTFETYAKYFVLRINDIKNDKNTYDNEKFDFDEYVKSIVTLENLYLEKRKTKEKSIEAIKIYFVISLYTTFILEEPIHPVGTKFPGNLELQYKDGIYYFDNKEMTTTLDEGDKVVLDYAYYEIYNDSIRVYPSNNEGPSAGFMQSLKLYDDLVDVDLSKNKKIAGTGTIDEDGNVGAIGAIDLKLYTAMYNNVDIFFVPVANRDEARDTVAKLNGKMRIVYVNTLAEAVSFLEGYES